MRIDEPGAGYIHFSDRLNDEYFRQLTAEKVVTRFHKGFKKRVFEKIRARNEALDCMCYSYAAYAIIGVNVNTLADKMEAETTQKVDNEQIERKQQPRRQQFVPKTGRNFVNSWR
jgi:phage terminase large subunit GpA-like protein